MADDTQVIPWSVISQHNSRNDCWVVIEGKVFDVTQFLDEHPGGAKIIFNFAGKDATPGFKNYHSEDQLKLLAPESFKGIAPPEEIQQNQVEAQEVKPQGRVEKEKKRSKKGFTKPPMFKMLNVFDFESVAKRVMKKEAWDYYSSGAEDEVTLRENHTVFQRIWFRPRVMVNVREVDTRTKILGYETSFPLYISATALARLADPEGEVALTKAAYEQGIIQMCPTLASCSLKEMVEARKPGQIQFYQLYVNPKRQLTENLVRTLESQGIKALFVTVDAPQLGRREKDMRNKFTDESPSAQKDQKVNRSSGTARAISAFIDPSLCWDDLVWLKSITSLPIILKGVQCAEDAILALKYGCRGVVLSNHGGRQLDYSRSGLEVLPEVMEALKSYENNFSGSLAATNAKNFEVYVDGGIRRGSDIFKALALGAKAVGIGRPVLYGLAAYGKDGASRVLEIFREELVNTMMMMGVTEISQIKPEMICTRNLSDHQTIAPKDYLYTQVYQPMKSIAKL